MKITNKDKPVLLKYIYIISTTIFLVIIFSFKFIHKINNYKLKFIIPLIILSLILTLIINKLNKKIVNIIDYLIFITNALIFTIILTSFIILPSKVDGSSMEETYFNGNRVFVNMLSQNYNINDIVVYNLEEDNEQKLIIKRLVAKKGDVIEIITKDHLSLLYINDELYKNNKGETYAINIYNSLLYDKIKENKYTLKENEIILLGDNANNSLDSRKEGIHNDVNIVGKVLGGK